ncbi:MAG: YchF/TatD family DNA exonuclease [Ignavibacteriae bacterium]|nr:YchF/TatD family DNA exonuclease [Ignavibacteriota bacterium]MCB9215931.1 YchF/TatD family DNA exonuclease [Ignavibacteria bacterium]
MELIDTHAHIYDKRFGEDFEEMLGRAAEVGVCTIISPATEPDDFPKLSTLKERYQSVEIALGTHPHSAAKVSDRDLHRLPEIVGECKAIAIGEIGLDYYYDFAPRDRQQNVFRHQLKVAKELDLPAVIHNRESDEDLLRIIEEEQDGSLQFQLHCFSSSSEVLQRALKLGAMISFTGNITFKKSTLDALVAEVPDDRLMIETDSPYMTPVPHRGKRNEPSFVGRVAEKIAEIRNVPTETIAQMTTQNARRFFALPLLILIAICSCSLLRVQAQTPEPTTAIDTVRQRGPFDKLIGIGPHLTSTTFIIDRVTQTSSLSPGLWFTVSPLQPLGFDRLQFDFIYTPARVDIFPDQASDSVIKNKFSTGNDWDTNLVNIHNSYNFLLRFNWNPKSFINFHASFGYTLFYNSYGVDRILATGAGDTSIQRYDELESGIGGGLGLTMNLETPFGIVAPTVELHYSQILGDRKLTLFHGDTYAVTQSRIGIIFYPKISEFLGLQVP